MNNRQSQTTHVAPNDVYIQLNQNQLFNMNFSLYITYLIVTVRFREMLQPLDLTAHLLFSPPCRLPSRHRRSLSCGFGETTSFVYLNLEEILSSNVSRTDQVAVVHDGVSGVENLLLICCLGCELFTLLSSKEVAWVSGERSSGSALTKVIGRDLIDVLRHRWRSEAPHR